MSFNEYKTVEREIIDNLISPALGWRYEPGDEVTREYRGGDESEMLLLPIVSQHLKRLNPTSVTSDERARAILTKLRTIRDNREWLAWLRGEQTFQFAANEKAASIKLVDFDAPSANDFLCSNQLWIQGAERRRPDILLFLNGIPIIDIEAKTAARGHVDWAEGAKQCARYDLEIGQLYASNCFCIGVNELRMKYGTPGAPLQQWQQWRDPSPHQIPSFDEMKCTLYGLLDRGNLLDLLRNFIVHEIEGGRSVKKVARYQQFRAANKIVERSLAVTNPATERRGIVWHTQGSGKSLTMIFAARKLWNDPILAQPTIIIVVDREQLEEQMAGELFRTNTENVAIASSRRELSELIRGDFRGVILTLIHKFDGIESEMTSRSNVVMLVDEAHRSQYGDLGIFMRSALPQAALFGLTGTPIELDDRHTPRAFGKDLGGEVYERYMDRYSISDSIRDGATKPIHYEIRLTDWTVAYADLDRKFESLFRDRSPEERKILLHEAKLDAILKHPRRIAAVAEDVAVHFIEKVRPNGYKAMLVCRDKEACALYKVALDAELQQRLGGDALAELTRIIVSEDPIGDSTAIKSHYLGNDRRQAIEDFKSRAPVALSERSRPENRFTRTEIVIVCDMLLTGFDAPIVQAMYLDKGMRNHTLLQAIARVNRPYDELKQYGLVLDYFGVFENLNEALHFDKNDLGEVAFPVQSLRDLFGRKIDELLAIFVTIPKSGTHASLMQALELMNDDDDRRSGFESLYRAVRVLYEMLQPDEMLRPFIPDYVWLTKFYVIYRKKFYPKEHFEVSEEDGAKTRALIREMVDVEEIDRDFPTYELDEAYLTKLEPLSPDAKALDIESMLDAELRIRLDEDDDVRPLSDRLKRIIEQKRAGTLAGIELLRELEVLTKDVVEVVGEADRPVADSIAAEARKRDGVSETDAENVAAAICEQAERLCYPGWYLRSHVDTELYRAFTIALAQKFKKLALHGGDNEFVERCIRILKKARYEAPIVDDHGSI